MNRIARTIVSYECRRYQDYCAWYAGIALRSRVPGRHLRDVEYYLEATLAIRRILGGKRDKLIGDRSPSEGTP